LSHAISCGGTPAGLTVERHRIIERPGDPVAVSPGVFATSSQHSRTCRRRKVASCRFRRRRRATAVDPGTRSWGSPCPCRGDGSALYRRDANISIYECVNYADIFTSDCRLNTAANSPAGHFLVGEIFLPTSSPISSQDTDFVFVFVVQERLLDAETDFFPELRELAIRRRIRCAN
jgi:hypothetical protein